MFISWFRNAFLSFSNWITRTNYSELDDEFFDNEPKLLTYEDINQLSQSVPNISSLEKEKASKGYKEI